MTYRDPDSGLVFASEDDYMRERMGFYDQSQGDPTVEEQCAARGHEYEGDDCGVGRCYCGEVTYPAGGP